MRIGFYAPMKHPGHPVPSGDRRIGRLFLAALEAAGHEVEVISTLRTWEGLGDPVQQAAIAADGEAEAQRLLARYAAGHPAPELVFVYHLYHKAPDWTGIRVSRELGIPYVLAEASLAPKRAGGPWQSGYAQSLVCIRAARVLFNLNPVDDGCLAPVLGPHQDLVNLAPFLEGSARADPGDRTALRQDLAGDTVLDPEKTWIVSVGMMREGDKLASFRSLGDACGGIRSLDWQLVLVGDGEAASQVRGCFAGMEDRVHFSGELAAADVERWLAASDLYAWPAVNEAFGMATLEAMRAGLPAVVQDYGGVSSLVAHGETGLVAARGDNLAFAEGMASLIDDPERRSTMAANARERFESRHTFAAARDAINRSLESLLPG